MEHKLRTLVNTPLQAAKNMAEDAAGTLGHVGKAILFTPLKLPGIGSSTTESASYHSLPGAIAGIEGICDAITPPTDDDRITLDCTDYGSDCSDSHRSDCVDDLSQRVRPDWCAVRWINVNGLHPYVVNQLREKFEFHTLAAEDVLHVPQRPKVEHYDGHLFVVCRMLLLDDGRLRDEQVSFFLFDGTLLSFQQVEGDVWQLLRKRIHTAGSRIRANDASYLLYALLDAVVDHVFPILEHYGDLLEALEAQVIEHPTPHVLHQIHAIKRELVLLRRVMWPMREMIDNLYRDEPGILNDDTQVYIRDVYDHAVQAIDVIETYREMAGSLTDLYLSAVSNRMNEIMKVLTILASFFIPITFVAGVYGMNFKYIPELEWKYAYAAFWGVCSVIVAGLVFFFYRRGWIGQNHRQ